MTYRKSELYLCVAARAIDNAGNVLAAFTLTLVLQQRGYGGIAVAALLLADAVPLMALAPVASHIVDRCDSKKILVRIGILQAALCTLLAFSSSTVIVLLLVGLLSAGVAFTSPTLGALLPAIVGRKNLVRANALIQTATTIGSLCAPALAGVLLSTYTPAVALLLNAFSFLIVPVTGAFLRTRRRGGRTNNDSPQDAEQLEQHSWFVWRDPILRSLICMIGSFVASLTAVNVIEVFFVRETLGASLSLYGFLGICWPLGMMLGATIIGRMNPGNLAALRIILCSLTGTAVIIVVIGTVHDVAWLVPLQLVGGLLFGIVTVLVGALLNRQAPVIRRGHALAMFGAVNNGATVLGFCAGGALMTFFDPRVCILISGSVTLGALTPFLARLPRRRVDSLMEN